MNASRKDARFALDLTRAKGPTGEFWKALGYDFLFKIAQEPEGIRFLDRARDHNSIRYLRCHYTFSDTTMVDSRAGGPVGGRVVRQEDGGTTYDFSRVNATFRSYVDRGMKPIVEFDFYPAEFARDGSALVINNEHFEAMGGPPRDWEAWEQLMSTFMDNLVREFGLSELESWYFEVWNEPDSWPREEYPVFFRMYDLFAAVVKARSPKLRVGGPACYKEQFMKVFLDHVTRTGSPLDFVSFHIYGLSGSWLNRSPRLLPQVSTFVYTLLWWQRLFDEYPELEGVERHLNEWGLCSHGDFRFVDKHPDLEYRNSEYAALFLVKLVDAMYALGDDHGFHIDLLLFWGAWFNAASGPIFSGSRDLVTSGGVPRPILTAFELLARLGDERLEVTGPPTGGRWGVLATRAGSGLRMIVYNFNETDDDLENTDPVHIDVNGIEPGTKKVREFRLDRENLNTYRRWQAAGRPEPDRKVVRDLFDCARVAPTGTSTVHSVDGRLTLDLTVPRHALRLLEIDDMIKTEQTDGWQDRVSSAGSRR